MNILQWTVDILMGLGLLGLAWRALTSPDLFRAIVLFISFGLLMALAWVRLDAPDVALAEAAIGAGLTGALLMAALARLRDTSIIAPDDDDDMQLSIHDDFNDDSQKVVKKDD
ncbi:MAG: DUF4040 domain-containing protein [Desulforhopalus sp.]